VVLPSFPQHEKSWALFYMKRQKPIAATHYFNRARWDIINELIADNWGWEFVIGVKHIGSSDFKNEFPEFEIIAEYRPSARDRKSRYAVYGRQLLF
jgi:hypothetical protein